MSTTSIPATAIPATAMRYRDVGAAADWLCSAFGFEKQTVLTDDKGAPLYVQLTFGRAMLMLAPVRPSPIDKYMRQPDEIGGAETQSGYYVVGDADAHYARAKAAGAVIILEIEDDDFGGRTYTCRDPEGHIWTFGTYDPWQGKFPEPVAAAMAASAPRRRGLGRRLARAVFSLIIIGGVGAGGWYGGLLMHSRAVGLTAAPPTPANLERRAALEAAEQAARKALEELEGERAAKADADKASDEAQQRAAEAEQAREAAERAASEARDALQKELAAKTAAASGTAELQKRIDEERRAREAAERAAKDARAELDKVQATKASAPGGGELQKRLEAAERAARDARAEVEKARADKAAAEMAKDFALGRAEEEQAGREAAEKAAKEARAELESKQSAPVAVGGPSPDVLKGSEAMQQALDEAKKRAADAEAAAADVHEQLVKEKAAKAAAWKVVGQLTKQLQAAKVGGASADAGDGSDEAPKKAKIRYKKKAAESE